MSQQVIKTPDGKCWLVTKRQHYEGEHFYEPVFGRVYLCDSAHSLMGCRSHAYLAAIEVPRDLAGTGSEYVTKLEIARDLEKMNASPIAALERQLKDDSPGTPLGILKGIDEFAVKHCGHDLLSAKPAVAVVLERFVELERTLEKSRVTEPLDVVQRLSSAEDQLSASLCGTPGHLRVHWEERRQAATFDFNQDAGADLSKRERRERNIGGHCKMCEEVMNHDEHVWETAAQRENWRVQQHGNQVIRNLHVKEVAALRESLRWALNYIPRTVHAVSEYRNALRLLESTGPLPGEENETDR